MKHRYLLLFPLLLLMPSCVGPDPTFVAASRATHDAIAPEYVHYVDNDPALTVALLDRWREAIESREVRK